MTLPASGSISLSQVNTELGYSSSAQISLNDSAVRTLFGKSSGAIAMSDGYGKANQFNLTISSNQTNVNLATYATSQGWNGSSKLVVTIDSGVYISSNSTGTPALTISGSFPGTVSVTNNGYIIGMGGAGGAGRNGTGSGGSSGGGGGLGLSVSSAVSITNNGTIGGGGGGGGGGGSTGTYDGYGSVYLGGGGGGGGRTGATNSSGGSVGSPTITLPGASALGGTNGSAGTTSSAGSGGNGWYYTFSSSRRGGAGGAGGSWGSGGSSGASATGDFPITAGPTSGGSAGGAVTGNANITWVATGTRLGSIS